MTKFELVLMIAIAVVFIIWFTIKSIKNKWVSSLIDTVNVSIKNAENNSLCKDGFEKKKYVMACVEAKCNELKIPYYILSKVISKLVDTIISHYNVISK